jgi:hypothetical protein
MTGPTPKRETERGAAYARGGRTKMLGLRDRTVTATEDAAGEQTPGQTANKSKDNRRSARGGPPVHVGGLALPAVGGSTGPRAKER